MLRISGMTVLVFEIFRYFPNPLYSTLVISASNHYHALLADAGWSSLAARRAHNPKVAGSNPAPATNIYRRVQQGPFLYHRYVPVFVFDEWMV